MTTRQRKFNLKSLERRFGTLTLGRFIAAWRLSECLSQREFARKISMSAANLCDIEKGRKGVSILKAAQIAKVIGFSPTVLVQLALQAQVEASGLRYEVEVKARAA